MSAWLVALAVIAIMAICIRALRDERNALRLELAEWKQQAEQQLTQLARKDEQSKYIEESAWASQALWRQQALDDRAAADAMREELQRMKAKR